LAVYNGSKLTHFTVSKSNNKIFVWGWGDMGLSPPQVFWPYHPHRVSAYGVILRDACGYWLQKDWSQRLKLCQLPDSIRSVAVNQYISTTTARVFTMSMMTTLWSDQIIRYWFI